MASVEVAAGCFVAEEVEDAGSSALEQEARARERARAAEAQVKYVFISGEGR